KDNKDSFYFSLDGTSWTQIGSTLQMVYTLPHFVGYRFALFNYATRSTGGFVDFDFFRMQPGNPTSQNPPPAPTPPPSGEVLTNGNAESGTTGCSVFGSGTLSSNTS